MAHSLSAKKRIRQNEKRRLLNKHRKAGLKEAVRGFSDKLTAGDTAGAKTALSAAYKKLDKVAAKGTIHKKTASRRKSRLAKALNRAAK